jgi:hypothetical protein
MTTANIRPKSTNVVSAGEIGQLAFNEKACAQKNVIVGGSYDILGPIGNAVRVGPYASIMVANTDAAAGHYVALGDSSIAAPTGLADGIYVPAGGILYISSGLNTYIRSDSASVGAYKVQDSIVAQTQVGSYTP